jgi:hypothetical protein
MRSSTPITRWIIRRHRGPGLSMALSLVLGFLAGTACGKHGASFEEDAGHATDTETPGESGTGTATNTDIAPDTGTSTDSIRDSESQEERGTETDIATDADAGTDPVEDSESEEGHATDSEEDGSTDTRADTDTAGDGAGMRLTRYSITSGAVVGHSSHFSIAVTLGGAPRFSGRSTNYRITAGIGGRVTP